MKRGSNEDVVENNNLDENLLGAIPIDCSSAKYYSNIGLPDEPYGLITMRPTDNVGEA